jgi:hypothetical protein
MKNDFLNRIDQLTEGHKPKYGKMTVQQMVCHCTDLYRLVLREITLSEKPNISAEEAIKLAQSRKTVPAPTEMDQVAGNGTKTSDFKTDLSLLKSKLKAFYALEKNYDYPLIFTLEN